MKLQSLPILALIATIAVTTEATDPAAVINLKSRIGDFLLNAATTAIQAKQSLIKSSTSAIINAKTNFLLKQLQHFGQFKANQINSVLELKKNLLSSKPTLPVQLTAGDEIQSAEQDVAPYSPPAVPIEQPQAAYNPPPQIEPQPPAAPPVEVPLTYQHEAPNFAYSPLPQLEPQPPAAPPVEVPLGPYPPPSYSAKRQLTSRQEQPVDNAHAQSSFRPQPTPSYDYTYNEIQYSKFPTPPPQPPVRTVQYV